MYFFLSITLIAALLAQINVVAPANSATSVSCQTASNPNLTGQNNLVVAPVHGSVFYIDTGQNQTVDAAYVGYKVTASAAYSNLWVSVDSFSGGVVNLANPNDAAYPIGSLANGATGISYFLLKAAKSTTLAQTHTVHIFEGRPDLPTSVEKYACNFSFIKVAETIKAAANKVNSIVPSTTSLVTGSTLTVTVRGFTGTIGQGSSLDGVIMWFSPVSRSTWPTSSLRLTSTTINLFNNKQYKNALNNATFTNQLFIKALTNGTAITSGSKYYWEASYSFTILGASATQPSVAPIAQISSGTQIKHTDISSLPSVSLATDSVSISVTVEKTASSSVTISSSKVTISYTIKITNTGTSSVKLDQIVDAASPSLEFKAGSAQVSSSAYPDPILDSSGNWIFGQPITIGAATAGSSVVVNLTYQMVSRTTCTGSTPFTYENSASAKIGTVTIGSTITTVSGTTTSGTCSTTTATVTNKTSTIPAEVTTQPATSVAISGSNASATLNGTINSYGTSGVTTIFQYSTDSTLASGVTEVSPAADGTTRSTSLTYAISKGISSLVGDTTYYFRVKVGTGTSAIYGAILSFTTPVVSSPPTVTTNAASNVTTTQANLNGTINPNAVSGGATAKFQYTAVTATDGTCPVSQLSVYTTRIVQGDSGNLVLTSSSPTEVTYLQTGLSANSYYCYRVVATYTASGTSTDVNGSWVAFKAASMLTQTITFTQPTSMNTNSTQQMSATTNATGLTVTYTSNSTSICTVSSSGLVTSVASGSGGLCSITASQEGNISYYPATPVTVVFPVVGTVTLSYDLNGATSGSVPASQTVAINGSVSVNSGSGISKTSFTFGGWNTSAVGTGTAYSIPSSITLSKDTTLYAVWNATITYDGNENTGGTVPASQTSVAGLIALQTNSGSLVRTGYTFAGWNTTSTATGAGSASYSAGASFDLTGNVTLYAEWIPTGKYRVTYYGKDNTGGTVPEFADVTAGQSYTVSSYNLLTKTGVDFGGWYTTSTYSGGTTYAPGASFTPSGNTNLYAIWEGTVTYDGNTKTSGTVPSSQTSLKQGLTFTTNNNTGTLAKTYYTFSGWNTTADGKGTTYLKNTSYTFNQSMTLYAKWIPIDIVVTFDDNLSGGEASPSYTQTISADTNTALSPNTFAPVNRAFRGWATSSANATAGTVAYLDGATINFVSNTTLYAVWATSYTVTYNAKSSTNANVTSGSAPSDINSPYASGSTVTVLDNTDGLTLTSYAFKGWCTTNNNAAVTACTTGTTYLAGDTFTISANMNLYAIWNPTYTVTYNVKNSDNSNPTSGGAPTDGSSPYATGSTVTVLGNIGSPVLALTGYTFAGWCTTNNATSGTVTSCGSGGVQYAAGDTFTISANTNLYAVWSVTTYTVTYNANNGDIASLPANQTKTYAVTLTLSSTQPTRSGYTFINWNTDSGGGLTTYESGGSYTANAAATLYAQWSATSYTITVNNATGGTATKSASTMNLETSPAPTITATPSTGYTFTSWSCTGATLDSSTANPASLSSPTGNISCTPTFTAVTYTITVNNSTGGTATGSAATMTVATSPAPTITATPSSGYSFTSWSCTGATVTTTTSNPASLSSPTGNITCTPSFSLINYTITVNNNTGGTGSSSAATMTISTSPAPTITATPSTGYTFTSWSCTGATVTTTTSNPASLSSPTGNISCTPTFTAITYTITVSAGTGGSASRSAASMTVATSPAPTVTATPSSGYTFANWSCTGATLDSNTANPATLSSPTANISCTANFLADNLVIVLYDGNTHSGGNEPSDATNYIKNTDVVTVLGNVGSPSLSKTGYTFSGWCTAAVTPGSSCTSPNTAYTAGSTFTIGSSNVTLYAIWAIVTYTITVNAGTGGTASSPSASMTVTTSPAPTITAVPSSGYTFTSWSCTGATVTTTTSNPASLSSPTGNVTCTASFTAITYNVTVNNNTGGTGSTSAATITVATTVSISASPSTGYTFTSWSCSGATITSTGTNPATLSSPTGDVTCTPTFTATAYTITVNNNTGGTATGSAASMTVATTPAPTITATASNGYTFTSWSCTGATVTSSGTNPASLSSPTGNITCTPTFTATVYTITVNNNTGGTGSGSAVSMTVATSPSPTISATASSGYTFTSWSCTGATLDSNTANPATLSSPTGNITCTPTFTAVTSGYTITVTQGANGTISPGTTSVASGGNQSFTITASSGYSIETVTVDGTGVGTSGSYTFTNVVANHTITASFRANVTPQFLSPTPIINSVMKNPTCSLGGEVTILGSYLTGATVTIDGAEAFVISNNGSALQVRLPAGTVGLKNLMVSVPGATASYGVTYKYEPAPFFLVGTVPYLYVNLPFTKSFAASISATYRIQGALPPGLSLNTTTGVISGTPTVAGTYNFTLIAENVCGSANRDLSLIVDREIPFASSCLLKLSLTSQVIKPEDLELLKKCLEEIKKNAPTTIQPLIFLSGGVPPNEPIDGSPTAKQRYDAVCDVMLTIDLIGQIMTGVFIGPEDVIEIIVYWPVPEYV